MIRLEHVTKLYKTSTRPALDRVIFRVLAPAARADELANGGIDLYPIGGDIDLFTRASSLPGVEIRRATERRAGQLTFNGGEGALLSEEKRGCRFVVIPRPKEEELKDLDETAKVEKLKEHKRIAAGLSEKLVAEDRGNQTFEAIAKGMGLEVTAVDPFPRSQPPEALKERPQLVQLAFSLTGVGASEVREVSDGYAAIELSALEEPKPLTFEEAKERIKRLVWLVT